MTDKSNIKSRLSVLVISDLFPNPPKPALGIFVERQTTHLQAYCDNVVVSPIRIFPHLHLWKQISQPSRFRAEWQRWQAELAQIPDEWQINGVPVHYPRYTSLPKQGFQAMWGFFAYPFLRKKLLTLHQEHSFDLIHAHYASTSGIIALLAQRWMQVPVVLSIHGSDITYTVKQHPLSAAIIRWTFNSANMVLANSTWTAKQIIHYGGNAEKVVVVRLGGTPEQAIIQTEATSSRQKGELVILSVGYLEERKGQAYVLKALKILKDQGYQFKYIIVGDGSKANTLKQLAKELELQNNVSFEGYKGHEAVWSYFAECDIFVLPSWNEAFGVVYIEALSQGKAVIGCEGEGGPEDLRALGDCIELVKPRDVKSLIQVLKRLIDDPQKRQQMGRLGQKIVEENFTWARNAKTTMQVYEQLRHRTSK